ncbi:MAG: DUF1273 family protein [Clostridia bacterium]|nr:DUF1273 family protein [Clostridia bacterium]
MADQIRFDGLEVSHTKNNITSDEKKNITCCFSGHRKLDPTPVLYSKLREAIIRAYKLGYRNFCAGGALGFDTVAALTVLALKRSSFPDISLKLILPYRNQHESWSEHNKKILETVLSEADIIDYVSEEYFKGCMFVRNRRLIESSSYCICYLENPESGTAFTVKLAQKNGLSVVNLANSIKTR